MIASALLQPSAFKMQQIQPELSERRPHAALPLYIPLNKDSALINVSITLAKVTRNTLPAG